MDSQNRPPLGEFRVPTYADIEVVLPFYTDPVGREFLGGAVSDTVGIARIGEGIRLWDERDFGPWVVADQAGCGGLVPGEAEQMAGGVWSRLLDYSIRDAFERLGLSEVWAETQQANTASLRMLERAGFKRSTTLTRHAQVQAVLVLRR